MLRQFHLRSKDGSPVIGRDPLVLVVGLSIVPDVPVPLGAVFRLSTLLEPGVLMVRFASVNLTRKETYLVTTVINNQVHDELHTTLVTGIFDLLPVFQCTVLRVDFLVVGNVVAHIGLRGLIHGGKPDDIDT